MPANINIQNYADMSAEVIEELTEKLQEIANQYFDGLEITVKISCDGILTLQGTPPEPHLKNEYEGLCLEVVEFLRLYIS